MPDDRLEAALREALRAEVSSAGLSISRAELHRRAERAGTGSLAMPRLLAPLLAVFVLAVGLVVVLGTRPGGFIAGPNDSPSPAPTSSPSSSPSPSSTDGPPRPSVLYEDQSVGALELTIHTPSEVAIAAAGICQWTSVWPEGSRPTGPRVSSMTTTSPMEAFGESLSVDVMPWQVPSPFTISRASPAGDALPFYAPRQGQLPLEAAEKDDGSGGLYRYADLGYEPAGIDPRSEPLGGDPAAERISASVSWSCEPPAASWTPEPTIAEPEPSSPPLDLAPLVLTLDGQGASRTANGTGGCGSFTDRSGNTGGDQCGSYFPDPSDYPPVVTAETDSELILRPGEGWQLEDWDVRAYRVPDVDASGGDRPEFSIQLSQRAGATPTGELRFAAPSEGRYVLVASVTLDGEGPSAAQLPFFYRLDVGPR
jgi:hypothetical protein